MTISCTIAFWMFLAVDWPQFLGVSRNGVYAGEVSGIDATVWKKDVGAGLAGPAVSGGRVILFHRLANRETVESLDAATGKRVWMYDYPTSYRDDFGFDEGPRAVPAIADGKVYTFGAEGALHCLDFASGKKIWSVDTHAPKGFFGAACAPLVDGSRVLLMAKGIMAFDKDTGKLLWTATNDEPGYSGPVVATIQGARHGLFFTRAGLVDLDPTNGKVRFQFPWRSRSHASVNAATPLVIGDLVFLSASYETGATVLEIAGAKPRQVWRSDDALSNHYATSVYRDGYLFGYHGRQEFGQSLRCIELKTGKVQWNVDGFGAGTVTLAEDRLLLLREGGELVLAPASPKEFKPTARAQVLPGVVRAYPAIADGRLYARNEKMLVCVGLK